MVKITYFTKYNIILNVYGRFMRVSDSCSQVTITLKSTVLKYLFDYVSFLL